MKQAGIYVNDVFQPIISAREDEGGILQVT